MVSLSRYDHSPDTDTKLNDFNFSIFSYIQVNCYFFWSPGWFYSLPVWPMFEGCVCHTALSTILSVKFRITFYWTCRDNVGKPAVHGSGALHKSETSPRRTERHTEVWTCSPTTRVHIQLFNTVSMTNYIISKESATVTLPRSGEQKNKNTDSYSGQILSMKWHLKNNMQKLAWYFSPCKNKFKIFFMHLRDFIYHVRLDIFFNSYVMLEFMLKI